MYDDIKIATETALEDLKHENNITREVKQFYEQIQFPGHRPMEQDSLIFLRRFSKLIDRLTKEKSSVTILDAGCGTGNTSLELASLFKNIQFVGIDISCTSIETAKKSARGKNLSNVKFYEWNLLDPFHYEKRFNVILCFGVLHHTAQMQKVMQNLYTLLESDGSLFLWVYGKYGRYFHSLNVEVLSMLIAASPNMEDPVDLAREFILDTSDGNILRDLLGARSQDPMLTPFYEDPTWIADQFLNPNEWLVSLKDLMTLSRDSGFKIIDWIGAPKEISKVLKSPRLKACFENLPEEKKIIALDLLTKMERYFLYLEKS